MASFLMIAPAAAPSSPSPGAAGARCRSVDDASGALVRPGDCVALRRVSSPLREQGECLA